MTSPEPRVSPPCGVRLHELRRHHLGELQPARASELDQHSAVCTDCSGRLQALRQEAEAFASPSEVAIASAQILSRLGAEPERSVPRRLARWRLPGLTGAVAAALVAVILVWSGPGDRPTHRIKGGDRVELEMFVNRPEGPVRAEEGAGLTSGDQVQFRYAAQGRAWLLVLSVDGRGVITSLYPAEGGESVPVEPGGAHVLEGSIILDDAVGVERVFAFFSDEPLSFEAVRPKVQAAIDRAGGDLGRVESVDLEELSEGVAQATLSFVKM